MLEVRLQARTRTRTVLGMPKVWPRVRRLQARCWAGPQVEERQGLQPCTRARNHARQRVACSRSLDQPATDPTVARCRASSIERMAGTSVRKPAGFEAVSPRLAPDRIAHPPRARRNCTYTPRPPVKIHIRHEGATGDFLEGGFHHGSVKHRWRTPSHKDQSVLDRVGYILPVKGEAVTMTPRGVRRAANGRIVLREAGSGRRAEQHRPRAVRVGG
jgi:hypothetical protein